MTAALADDLCDVVLVAFEFLCERVIALRLLQRIEIFSLHILDDGKLERIAVRDIERDDRHLMETRSLRGAPAAFARNDLVTVVGAFYRPDYDRLDHAVRPDRTGELPKLGLGEGAARIAGIWSQKLDRNLALRARPVDMGRLAADIADQTCKAAAQSRTRFIGHCRQLPWIHKATPVENAFLRRRRGWRG